MLGAIVWENENCICVWSLTEKGDEPPAKLLDDLFLKTKAAPCIYWLPLTEEQVGFTRPNLPATERCTLPVELN